MTMTILVVEDDPAIQDMITELLMDEGYVVLTAPTGMTGLEILAQQASMIRLVILDLMMPGLNGWEVSAQIQANPALRRIPILIVSAITALEARTERLGVARVLAKPFKVTEFLAVVDELYSSSSDQ
jgi:DNA-binding response OmpR family regulator